MSILSFKKMTTKSSVISSLFSSNPWANILHLLEYCFWSSLSFFEVSTLLFRLLTFSFKLFIFYFFSFLSFSKSSNLSKMCWNDPVSSASCLSSLICIDFVSLQKLYISTTFASRFLKLTNISEISLVLLVCWNASSSMVSSALLVFELPSLTFFLSSSGFDSPLRSLFFWGFIEILWNIIHNFFV